MSSLCRLRKSTSYGYLCPPASAMWGMMAGSSTSCTPHQPNTRSRGYP